jgi:hypothetical protein
LVEWGRRASAALSFPEGANEPGSPIKSMSRRNRRAAPSFRRRFNDLEKEVE